jgi:hypothetical protein
MLSGLPGTPWLLIHPQIAWDFSALVKYIYASTLTSACHQGAWFFSLRNISCGYKSCHNSLPRWIHLFWPHGCFMLVNHCSNHPMNFSSWHLDGIISLTWYFPNFRYHRSLQGLFLADGYPLTNQSYQYKHTSLFTVVSLPNVIATEDKVVFIRLTAYR